MLLMVGCLVVNSCGKEETFDGSLIVGKWVSGTEYYRYDVDSTGVTWDTSDDVYESEGQPFTWSFDESTSRLTVIHQMEMGGVVPKSYTMKTLNDSVMEYKDNYGNLSKYTRVTN